MKIEHNLHLVASIWVVFFTTKVVWCQQCDCSQLDQCVQQKQLQNEANQQVCMRADCVNDLNNAGVSNTEDVMLCYLAYEAAQADIAQSLGNCVENDYAQQTGTPGRSYCTNGGNINNNGNFNSLNQGRMSNNNNGKRKKRGVGFGYFSSGNLPRPFQRFKSCYQRCVWRQKAEDIFGFGGGLSGFDGRKKRAATSGFSLMECAQELGCDLFSASVQNLQQGNFGQGIRSLCSCNDANNYQNTFKEQDLALCQCLERGAPNQQFNCNADTARSSPFDPFDFMCSDTSFTDLFGSFMGGGSGDRNGVWGDFGSGSGGNRRVGGSGRFGGLFGRGNARKK